MSESLVDLIEDWIRLVLFLTKNSSLCIYRVFMFRDIQRTLKITVIVISRSNLDDSTQSYIITCKNLVTYVKSSKVVRERNKLFLFFEAQYMLEVCFQSLNKENVREKKLLQLWCFCVKFEFWAVFTNELFFFEKYLFNLRHSIYLIVEPLLHNWISKK